MALDGFGLTMSHNPRVEQNKTKTNNRDRLKNCKETIQKEVPTATGLFTTVFGGYTTEVTQHDAYTSTLSLLEGDYTYSFEAIDHHNICGSISPIPRGTRVEELKLHNIYLNDVNTDGATEVLFGADVVGNSVKINEEGRIEVRLPFIENHPQLFTNYGLAMKRVNGTIKKLKSKGYYEAYRLVLNELIHKRIIVEVTEELGDKSCHCLPHRHVIKLGSSTPIRPVFTALAQMMPAILARCRMNRLGIVADIQRVFLQLSIAPEDRDYLRFLWETTAGRVIIYRHCRVVFGVSPSPFQLAASIEYHLGQVLAECKSGVRDLSVDIVEWLKGSFYFDN
ncbi:hypothetical protein ILUMI_01799 [Ignelater luminosus]|uniref:Reverse transcriptase domain-containing protein n=1 Tax=Ignelater luminosus TaxID=2038154 RepID=A0A8K0GNU7_IGNLU|nr:hypothetical protein ILUMI_01799 [Ignelater luminosus]